MDTNPDQGVTDLLAALDSQPDENAAPELDEVDHVEPVTEEVGNDQSPEAAFDEEEGEFGGIKFKAPKKAWEVLANLQKDYTQKTQTAAELRRAADEQTKLVAHQQQLLTANIEKVAEVKGIQARLSEFQKLDWQSLADQDPAQATKLMAAYQATRDQAAQKQQELAQSVSQQQQLMQMQRQQLLEKGRDELSKRLPEFSDELATRIAENTKTYGYTPDELQSITDPRLVHILHDAMQFRALKAQQPKAARTLAEAPKVIKPSAPQPVRQNQAALDRLKKTGRAENLIDFL